VDLDVAVSGVLAASVGSALYGVASGLVALLAGAATGRRSAGLAVGAVVAGIGYLATTLAELATWAEPLRHISLLHHATAGDPVQNGMPGNYLVLVAVSVAVLGATVWVFDRRDLT
jgi:ABC-2 type transport system permease protein